MSENVKIAPGLRRALWLVWGSLALSGLLWLLVEWLIAARLGDGSYAWKHNAMLVHGAAAGLFLLVLGALTPHIKAGLAGKRNRLSGLLNLALLAFLIGSAWWLYYGTDEPRRWMSLGHSIVGGVLALLLPIHAWLGRRSIVVDKARK